MRPLLFNEILSFKSLASSRHVLLAETQLYIMKTLKDSYHSTGEKLRHKDVCETLCEIIKVEEVRDKETVAESEAELAIAEEALGIDSKTRLQSALCVLRKRKHTLTEPAALCLAAQVTPAKRLRKKVHPEEVASK